MPATRRRWIAVQGAAARLSGSEGSTAAHRRSIKGPFPDAASKGGLTPMTEIRALEASRFGVRVNALAPRQLLTDVSRVLRPILMFP